jgi:methylenetetrahydrofolate reductase (NADPH)
MMTMAYATTGHNPADDPAATTQRIKEFMRGFSIEATRLDPGELQALKTVLPAGAAVYLTAIPGRKPADQIEPAKGLRALGFEPIPHIAVRNFASAGALESALADFTSQAGVRSVLVIAGDRDPPAGPFSSAVDVIESGLLQRYGITEVAVAGYPQGHPRLSEEVLDLALTAKLEAAQQTGLAVHIATQFAFDAEVITNWLVRLRDLGIENPVRIGMAGPTNFARLVRYAHHCGVSASVQGLTRQAGLIKHLLGTSTPDAIIRPLAEAHGEGRLGQVASHFYSFGGAAATARWAATVAAGQIVPSRTGGFAVEPAG